MSKTIDQRVVEMSFDNRNFEKNVQTTMSTLDKLKQKLNLTGASKGLENIEAKAKKMDLSGISSALDSVSNKFSALEVIGITALANITNSAVNAGKRLLKSLSIDQITAGFDKFGKKTTSVATLQAQGFALKEVNEQLERLNWFTDETSYNYTDMVDNIAKFTATGKGLTESVNAMEGIATWAALSGQNAQKASAAMYQLSQALGAGVMRKEDYKSIQNASMDTDEFRQKALDAAVALKTLKKNSDGTYKSLKATSKSGATAFTKSQFADSLTEGQWFTSDVMMKVFNDYSKAVDEIYKITEEKGMLASEVIDQIHTKAKKEGISTNKAIKALGYSFDEFALKAFESAQKARTFADAIDATKDAVSTGWMKTFEIIFGNAEEATELWTGLANTLWDVFASGAETRNELLQGWKDAGGRTATIDAIKNMYEGITNVVKPIKEAFRDIFPPLTAKQLTSFSEKLKELTGNFAKFTEKYGPKVKSTFKGIFAVVDIVASAFTKVAGGLLKVIGSLLGFTGGILTGTATLGDFLSKLRDSIKSSNLFGKAIDKIVSIIQNGINKIKEFGKALKEGFKSNGYEGFVGFLKAVWELITKIGSGISKAFGGIGQAIADAFGKNNFMDVINSGLFTGILYGIFKDKNSDSKGFLEELQEQLVGKDSIIADIKAVFSNIKGILTDVRECLQAYQEQLKAGTLLKIAGAIGILAASIFVISTINPEKLGGALAAITVLFAELAGTMYALTKITPGIKTTLCTIPLMISMSTALLILAGALKIIGSMNWKQLGVGLTGVAGGLGILVGALYLMPEKRKFKNASKAIRSLSISLLILAGALKIIGSMSWSQLGRSLTGIVASLTAMVGAVNLLPKQRKFKNASKAIRSLSISLLILAGAMKIMGSMTWGEIARGLVGMAAGLIAMVSAVKLLPKDTALRSLGMIGLATSLVILSGALKIMGSMSWSEVGRGLTVLGGSLLILSLGLLAMKKSLAAAPALLVAAAALNILIIPLKILGSMSWGSIIKSLVSLAGVFIIFGVAGEVLTPLVPILLGLSAAFVLFGIATLGIGAGLILIATGITALAASLAIGATAILAGITVIIVGLLGLIPIIISKLGEAILAFCKVIGDCAPAIVDTILKLIAELLKSIATYTPMIANSLFDILIGILDVLATRMPELITSVVKLINNFFVGIANALKNVDGANLLKGVIAAGIMAALVYVLAGISGMIGPAMIGLLGVGALIAELAIILAAIGALAQIPGLTWLIGEGGNLLEQIGTAIGRFIGGLVGGIAQGFTSSLPQIATDLSEFMINIKPFIEGATNIDTGMLDGVKALVGAILAITGANIINSIASFLTGKDSLSEFGNQLVPFGESMKAYGKSVTGIDTQAILASADAAKALTQVANAIPNSGGLVSVFTGDNKISTFGEQLVSFGESMKAYGESVTGIDSAAIMASADAAKALTQVANAIPNSGGLVTLFEGDNKISTFGKQLVPFGEGMKSYSESVAGINSQAILASADAAKALAEMTKYIPNEGGIKAWFTGESSISKFASQLPILGTGLKLFSDATSGIVAENIIATSTAAKNLADMVSVIPNEGGIKAWFTGESSILKFASQLPILGTGLKLFSDTTSGIVAENIIATSNAAKNLAEMTKYIPNEGGIKAWFTGESSISKFASQLPTLGMGLKLFSVATSGIVAENIVAASNAAKSLAEMTKYIPNEGGIKAWFTGESSISNFSDSLPKLGEGLAGFSTNVKDIKAENIIAASNAAKALAEMTSVIPKEGGVKAWFTGETSISNFADKLPKLGEGLAGFSKSVEGINPENVTAASNAAKSLGQMADTVPKKTDKIIDFGDNLVKFGSKLKSYFEKTSGVTAETIKSSTDAINSIKTATTGLNSSSLSSLSKAIDNLVESLKKMSKVSESSVKGFSNAMKKLGQTNVKSVVSAFNEAGPKLKKAGQNVVSNISKGVESQGSKIKETGAKISKKLSDGIESKQTIAKTACRKLVSECATTIGKYKKDFYSAGKNLVDGFASGISENSYKAAAKSKAMAEAAEKAARKQLKINSPSKIFRKIGSGVPEGFAQGITMFGSNIKKSIGTMGSTAVSTTKNLMSNILDNMNMDIDSEPTIKPVLDLTNIESGVGNMNRMFNGVGIDANLNAISYGMNNKLQNGRNDDVVSAINRLSKDLSNVGGNTYNVNGISYDDDSNITNAVKDLIRAIKVEGRM